MGQVNKKPRTGYLYRRAGGKHLPLDGGGDGVIYLRYQVQGVTETRCLHTTDADEAQRVAAAILGPVRWGDRAAFLHAAVVQGEAAARELNLLRGPVESIPLRSAWQSYLDCRRRPQSGPGTLANYERQWSAFVKWLPEGVVGFTDVTPALAEKYAADLEGRVGGRTVNKHLSAIRLVWRVLAREQVSPWADLRAMSAGPVRGWRRLTYDECRVVYAKAGVYAGVILAGYYTGLRSGDVRALDWSAYDKKRQVLKVLPSKTSRAQKMVWIPVLPQLADYLKALHPRQRGMIFKGLPPADWKFSQAVSDVLAATGVVETEAGKVGFHSLRKTFVSAMDEAGAPTKVTDSITGHASSANMHDRYSQPDIELAREWMAKALKRL